MSARSIVMLVLPCMVLLASIPECRSENQEPLVHKDPTLVPALKGVSSALECFGGSLKDGLRSLSNEVLEMKEQIKKLNSNLESKPESRDEGRDETLTQEIAELNRKLASKDETILRYIAEAVARDQEIEDHKEKVMKLTQANEDLKKNLTERDEQVKNLTENNEDLKKKLEENNKQLQDLNNTLNRSQQRVQELHQELKQCNNTAKEVKRSGECLLNFQHPQLKKMKDIVKTFVADKNWGTLKKRLQSVLDSSSCMYKQLDAGSVYNVGYYGYTELASLLLCLEMPIDTVDSSGDSMLNGAIWNNKHQLVKMLVGRGAGVNVRGKWTTLIWASYSPLEIVQLLVNAGADTTARDNNGRNALSWATSRRNTAVVQYLSRLPQ